MISIFKSSGGKVVHGSISDIDATTFTWVSLVNPTEEEIEGVSAKTGLPVDEMKDSVHGDLRPTTHESENHSAIFYDAVSEAGYVTLPVGIFLMKTNTVITACNEQVEALKKLEELARNDKSNAFESPGKFVRILLDLITSTYFKQIDKIEDLVDESERIAFESPSLNTEKSIFENKKKLFAIHKSLLANREVVSAIEKDYVTRIPKKEAMKFRSVYEDIATLIDVEETLRDISTGVLDVYLSAVSNNLNITLKRLTAWASLILVPTLITGIYGMNFKALPELTWQYGYFFALGLMGFSVLTLFIIFKAKKYI